MRSLFFAATFCVYCGVAILSVGADSTLPDQMDSTAMYLGIPEKQVYFGNLDGTLSAYWRNRSDAENTQSDYTRVHNLPELINEIRNVKYIQTIQLSQAEWYLVFSGSLNNANQIFYSRIHASTDNLLGEVQAASLPRQSPITHMQASTLGLEGMQVLFYQDHTVYALQYISRNNDWREASIGPQFAAIDSIYGKSDFLSGEKIYHGLVHGEDMSSDKHVWSFVLYADGTVEYTAVTIALQAFDQIIIHRFHSLEPQIHIRTGTTVHLYELSDSSWIASTEIPDVAGTHPVHDLAVINIREHSGVYLIQAGDNGNKLLINTAEPAGSRLPYVLTTNYSGIYGFWPHEIWWLEHDRTVFFRWNLSPENHDPPGEIVLETPKAESVIVGWDDSAGCHLQISHFDGSVTRVLCQDIE